MKLFIIKLCTILILVSITFQTEVPEYEAPMITKRTNPFNQQYNARLDNLNDSSEQNYQRYLNRRKKGGLTSELVRGFRLEAFENWMEFTEKENLMELDNVAMLTNINTIKVRSIELKNFIGFRSNTIFKHLALLDLKLKEKVILDTEINNVTKHPGNISSNSGNNLIFKNRLEDVINIAASVHGNFNTNFDYACSIIGNENSWVKQYHDDYMSAKKVIQPHFDTQFYPEQDGYMETNRPKVAVREWDTSGVMPDVPVRNNANPNHKRVNVKNEEPLPGANANADVNAGAKKHQKVEQQQGETTSTTDPNSLPEPKPVDDLMAKAEEEVVQHKQQKDADVAQENENRKKTDPIQNKKRRKNKRRLRKRRMI